MAEIAGISNNYISYIETGKKATSLKTMKKIADAFNIAISDLFKDITPAQKTKTDYTTQQILYLIRDKSPSTKKLFLKLCQAVVEKEK